MKKLIVKSLLMVSIMVGISNYILYIMTGKSPITQPIDLSFSTPKLQSTLPSFSADEDTIYKWTDTDGKVHYASKPPENTQLAEKMQVNPDVNLIQGLTITQQPSTPPQIQTKPTLPQAPQGHIYHPESIQKLMKDAKNVQTLLNEREQTTQRALEKL